MSWGTILTIAIAVGMAIKDNLPPDEK